MKSLAIIFLGLALSGLNAQPVDYESEMLMSNPIDDLVKEALEYIRKLMRDHEPFPVPEMPVQNVKGDGIDLSVTFKNLYVSKASGFTIDHIENNILQLWAKFGVTVPTMHLEGGYDVTGNVKGKSVTGSGNFKLDITGLVTSGYVEVGLVDSYVQMKKLDIDYDVNDVKFSADGLHVDGISSEELASLFDTAVLDYCQNNKAFISQQVSVYVQGYANDIMRGKSLQALLDWLKKFIHG